MSWHFSQALVVAYSGAICSTGELYARSNSMHTPAAYYWPDKTTEHSRLSRFGMTSELLTDAHGAGLLMSCLEDFRARTSAQQAAATDWTASEVGCGRKWLGSLAKYDPDSRSWRTPQFSLLGGLDEFSGTFPKWGSMRNGECWERETATPNTSAIASGLWPTPTVGGGGQTLPEGTSPTGQTPDGRKQTVCLERYVQQVERKVWPTPTVAMAKGSSAGALTRISGRSRENDRLDYAVEGDAKNGRLNPTWVEWLMGWPLGWTELSALATGKFREFLSQHGTYLENINE